jgi:hypothetical protein
MTTSKIHVGICGSYSENTFDAKSSQLRNVKQNFCHKRKNLLGLTETVIMQGTSFQRNVKKVVPVNTRE